MRIKLLLLVVLSCICTRNYSQSIHVDFVHDVDGIPTAVPIKNAVDIPVSKGEEKMQLFKIISQDLLPSHVLKITVAGVTVDYNTPKTEAPLDFMKEILNKEVTIQHFDDKNVEITGNIIKFRFISDPKKTNAPIVIQNQANDLNAKIDKYIADNYPNLEPTPFGLLDNNAPENHKNIIHVFFDYLGNSLVSTVPSGISNAQYMVHIIYPFSTTEPSNVSYSIKQKTGSFSSSLLFNNANISSQIPTGLLQSGEKFDDISERKFLLATATDDLSFDIIAAVKDDQITRTVLGTYTIKMSPTYHGSFDVGFVKTNLSNPTFNHVQLPGSVDQVVKLTDDSPKGVVTVMASFYVSPIILLESLFGKKIPFYKLTGRNFLDDHKVYERFYPTIGVGVSDKAFENIFYGINWEIARGLSIFGGWHYGKVNTFEMPNFEAGITPVTSEQFEFYQNTKWKTSTAFGIKLDIMIVRNLFGAATTP